MSAIRNEKTTIVSQHNGDNMTMYWMCFGRFKYRKNIITAVHDDSPAGFGNRLLSFRHFYCVLDIENNTIVQIVRVVNKCLKRDGSSGLFIKNNYPFHWRWSVIIRKLINIHIKASKYAPKNTIICYKIYIYSKIILFKIMLKLSICTCISIY